MRLTVAVALCCFCTLTFAADPAHASIKKDTRIPSEGLSAALETLAKDYDFQVLYRTEVVKDLKTHGAIGSLTSDEALTRVLSGTGLTYKYLDPQTVTLIPVAAVNGAAATDQSRNTTQDGGGKSSSQDFLVAQATPGSDQGPATVENQMEQASKKTSSLQEVVVTGSRIPLKAVEGPQRVSVYTREDVDQSGQTSLSDFLNTLPEVSVSVGENGFQTFGGATTVQLHGLPIGTTLVLIDGRRVEPSAAQGSSGIGEFFDLNNIPLAAVERVEVVSDGSSAIYGSDAIAGVVNIILKKDFDGLDVHAKYGTAKDSDEYTADITWGRVWDRGSLSATASYQSRGQLSILDRSVSATAVGSVQPWACSPGNVFSLDGTPLPGLGEASNAGVPAHAMGALTTADFLPTAGKLNSCNVRGDAGIIPKTEREGLLLQGHYQLTPKVDFFATFLGSHVQQDQAIIRQTLFGIPGALFSQYTVGPANPFNPFRETVGVTYSFATLPPEADISTTTFTNITAGVRGKFGAGWEWEVSASDAQDSEPVTQTLGGTNSAALQSALNSGDPATALNPFTTGDPASSQVLNSLFYDWLFRYHGATLTTSAFARGPVVTLPAGPLEVVFGGEFQMSSLSADVINEVPYVAPNTYSSFSRNNDAVFAEARVPILNAGPADTGQSLTVTLAGRFDHYDEFGGKSTPQFGVEWKPISSLLFRGAFSRAFKAPSLFDLNVPQTVSTTCTVNDPRLNNRPEVVTCISGGNPNLAPETGRTSSFGFSYGAEAARGLQLSVTQWDTHLDDAIQSLAPQTLIDNESVFQPDVVRSANCGNSICPISLVNSTSVNFGSIHVAGLDYQVSYRQPVGAGELVPQLRLTQTYRYDTALIPGAPEVNALSAAQDTGDWAPRLKGIAALQWLAGAYTAKVAARYVSRYRDYDSTNEIGNFWIFDANTRVDIGRLLSPTNSLVGGAYLELGAVNLLNRLPQVSNYLGGEVGYDPSQSDVRGRFVYAQVGAKW